MKSEKSILIEDGIVKVQKTEIYKEISLQDFYNLSAKNANFSTGLMSRNCRYYERTQDKEIFVIEDCPMIRTIRAVNAKGKISEYSISLPWIIYIFIKRQHRISEFYIFCSKKQISSLKDMLFEIPLTNVDKNGSVCLGNIEKKKQKPEIIIKEFWQSTFNLDYLPEWFKNKKGGIKSYRHWSNMTKKDSSFILSVRFTKIKTLEKTIRSLFEDDLTFLLDNIIDNNEINHTVYVDHGTTTGSAIGIGSSAAGFISFREQQHND